MNQGVGKLSEWIVLEKEKVGLQFVAEKVGLWQTRPTVYYLASFRWDPLKYSDVAGNKEECKLKRF